MTPLANLRVLIVEDDSILRFTVLTQLGRLSFSGKAIENGKDALDELKTGNYDIVLMDVQMPVMSGLEATEEIRQWEKDTSRKPIPIVAMTANPNRRQCRDVGMDDFLFKPVMLDALKSVLDKWTGDAA